ncbi:Response regulator receiver domain-containing protein [Albimonas pacifica]|uniref:Response regulator receiver domain-containing protein n=2 Tax=Albimonas pacifica TaxID=1114924 RepID=A0A1I3HVR9_9RHOB|nr:Response regulator receiver domain-containing protein [Albimonas pacifica]
MRCLIVEDYVELAELWRLELADLGFEAVAVHSAEAAFAHMLLTPFDLVIADLGLPDGSGLTVAQSAAIRAPGAAVIVVTGQADYPHGELFGMSTNIVAVFRKTSDLNDMLAFADHLRVKRARALGQGDAALPPAEPAARASSDRASLRAGPPELRARLRAAG